MMSHIIILCNVISDSIILYYIRSNCPRFYHIIFSYIFAQFANSMEAPGMENVFNSNTCFFWKSMFWHFWPIWGYCNNPSGDTAVILHCVSY